MGRGAEVDGTASVGAVVWGPLGSGHSRCQGLGCEDEGGDGNVTPLLT
jgi:hypothetical protein